MSSSEVNLKISKARDAFAAGKTKPLLFRRKQLENLLRLVDENEQAICNALKKDLNRPLFESSTAECAIMHNMIVDTLDNLDEWAKPEFKSKNLLTLFSDAFVRKEPFGLCLVIASWNYPFALLLIPVMAAISAGNCVVLKPSESSTHCAALCQDLIPKYLDKDCYPVVVLDGPQSADLVQNNRFDFIFFTGGTEIGRSIMKSAAKYLTPVILELGGKNPCYVDETCDLHVAAKRICWGRCVNSGQICLAPEYVLCHPSIRDKLVDEFRRVLIDFYGEDPQKSPDYSRIINDRQMARLKKQLTATDGKIVIGGVVDEDDRYVSPTVVVDVKPTSSYMQQEMFGPILMIMTATSADEAISIINKGEKPLALYIFSNNKAVVKRIIDNTSSGGITVNDCTMHYAHNELPFGGVGNSGIGCYHGKYGFDAFSHKRSCLFDGTPEAMIKIRYPPYAKNNLRLFNFLLKKKQRSTGAVGTIKNLAKMGVFAVIIAYLLKFFFEA